jgi:hypothetical protein
VDFEIIIVQTKARAFEISQIRYVVVLKNLDGGKQKAYTTDSLANLSRLIGSYLEDESWPTIETSLLTHGAWKGTIRGEQYGLNRLWASF